MVDTDPFWSMVCQFRHQLWLVIMFMLFMFILNSVAFLFLSPGAEGYVVAQFNATLILLFGGFVSALYYRCLQRSQRDSAY